MLISSCALEHMARRHDSGFHIILYGYVDIRCTHLRSYMLFASQTNAPGDRSVLRVVHISQRNALMLWERARHNVATHKPLTTHVPKRPQCWWNGDSKHIDIGG